MSAYGLVAYPVKKIENGIIFLIAAGQPDVNKSLKKLIKENKNRAIMVSINAVKLVIEGVAYFCY